MNKQEIRENISCPQFGDNKYGKWGALRLEQRLAYKELIEQIESADNVIKSQYREIERLKEEYMILQNASDEVEEELQQRINKAIEYIELYTETTKVDNVRFPFELKELHLSTACRKRLLDILRGEENE